jgi:hypothetical protein
MIRTIPILIALGCGLSAVAGLAHATPDTSTQAARDYLEGIWLVGEKPDKGACLAHWYRANQVEFEFRKSGGRVMIFEPADLYTSAAIPQIEIKDDVVTLKGRSREGEVKDMLSLRRLDADRFQWVPRNGDKADKADIVYRCGPPDRSVNGGVPMASLALLTPVLSGAQTFLEIKPGEDDRQVCRNPAPNADGSSRRALQFELLGPDHYWVFGEGGGQRPFIEFDRVGSIRQTDAHTLKLEMEDHPKDGPGWSSPGGPDDRYFLTVIDKGDHIEVPELSTTYVRCRPDEAGSYGMHRMS